MNHAPGKHLSEMWRSSRLVQGSADPSLGITYAAELPDDIASTFTEHPVAGFREEARDDVSGCDCKDKGGDEEQRNRPDRIFEIHIKIAENAKTTNTRRRHLWEKSKPWDANSGRRGRYN
jgi:hypothetical protein